MNKTVFIFLISSLTICILTLSAAAQEFPSDTGWNYMNQPSEHGWSAAKLQRVHQFITDSTQITGFMIIQHGKIVFKYGDVRENSFIASCRKSILAMLYGNHVQSGEINLDETLAELNIDDVGGLFPSEKQATVKDILGARSGVFHEASNPGDNLADAPKRGSVKHGEYWLYNNWDFNVAGYIFEQKTHTNIYDELERVIAKPLQMQDWDRALQHKDGDSTKSLYKAYPMWFSTRDMARIGLVMLNKGRWKDKQVIPKNWVSEMVQPFTNWQEVNRNSPNFRKTSFYFGYGYYWWLWQNINDERFTGAYSASGAWGQNVSVFPAIDAVIVLKTNDIYERETTLSSRYKLQTLCVQAFGQPK